MLNCRCYKEDRCTNPCLTDAHSRSVFCFEKGCREIALHWQENAIVPDPMPQPIASFIESSKNCEPQNVLTSDGLLIKGNLWTEEVSVSDTDSVAYATLSVSQPIKVDIALFMKAMELNYFMLLLSKVNIVDVAANMPSIQRVSIDRLFVALALECKVV